MTTKIGGKFGAQYKDEYKKVAIRFLKESGIYENWKNYITENGYCSDTPTKSLSFDDWYNVVYIDRIFGRTIFSEYLKRIHPYTREDGFSFSITELFRYYLDSEYPGQYNLSGMFRVNKLIAQIIKDSNSYKLADIVKAYHEMKL